MIPTVTQISNSIRQFADPDYSGFIGWPGQTFQSAAIAWGDIFSYLFNEIEPNVPQPIKDSALEAFLLVLQGWGLGVAGVPILQNAFQQGSVVIATGMITSGYTGIPPPLPPLFTLTGLITKSAMIEQTNIAQVLYTWVKTGIATNTSSTINWF